LYHLRPGDGKILAVPGVGLSDVLQSSVRPLLSSSDLRTLSALDFLLGDYDPNTSVLITELDNPILAGEVKILLSDTLEDEYRVFFLHDSASPAEIPLYELDRQPDIDHLSAVFVPGSDFMARNSFVLNDLLRIMDRLRDPDGCPWDRIQTHQSLRPYLAEEAWECIAAIDQEEPLHLANELGDLLFQIVFHSSIGKSFDEFTMNDVINSICRKMIHRHPHVFGNSSSGSSAVPSVSEWERLKRSETGSKSVLESLDDISPALPSLKYAAKLIRKISLFPAFRRDTAEIISEIRDSIDHPGAFGSETDEGRMGRFLFLCAELCDSLNLDGELILHRSVTDLKKRIQAAGEQAASDGKSMESLTFAELCVYLSHVEGEIE
jgi:tetrapyrrole methylase family protein/MazG family protein